MADAGIEDEINRQKDDDSLLRAFLRDAMKQKQAKRSRDLDLERQIKELVYDVVDIHKSWLIRTAAVTAKNTTCGRGPLDKVGYRVAREIKSVRYGRLDPMLRMIRSYIDLQVLGKQPTKPNEVTSVQLNKVVPPIGQNNIVGFEDEAETFISYLMEETKELDVISITGMPGIGKTTLAWKIYQNEMIHNL